KEGIYYFREFNNVPQGRRERVFCGSNPWPNDEYVPRFQTVIWEYFEKTQALASKLLGCMAIFLGWDFFNKEFTNDPFAQIAMFHYPPHPTSKDDPEVWGVGRHTDYGMLTVLLQDDVGGLEVETKDGLWMDVPPVPGSLIINIGDMVEIWTNGAFKAPPHRVKLSATNHRLSVAMFYEPGFESVISPIPVDKALIPLEKSLAKPSLTFPIRYGDYVLTNRMLDFLKRNCPGIVGSTSSTSNLILVENIRRRATRFILRNSNLCYKAHLIKLKLLPLSYWLEYLDFFFKCLHGLIDFTHELSYYFSFLKGNTRCASSGLHLKITLMWNSLPKNIKDSDIISSFKSKLKSFYFTKLLNAFDRDNFRSFKLICHKCRSVNTSSVCTC
ncbi:unnamed protein product, partial [Pocillopora meandrina]